MYFRLPSRAAGIGATVGLGVLAALAWVGLRPAPAGAQGIMAAPACQCSTATAIPGLQTQVVHCVCGGVTCVIGQQGSASPTTLMQCVK